MKPVVVKVKRLVMRGPTLAELPEIMYEISKST